MSSQSIRETILGIKYKQTANTTKMVIGKIYFIYKTAAADAITATTFSFCLTRLFLEHFDSSCS